jgi:DNA-binding NarL/FixJ family response regulator
MMPVCRVVLADDHVLVRQGLKKLVETAPDLEVVGEAGDGLALLSLLQQVKPDLLVIDISMPHVRGIEAIQEAKALYPDLKALVLTMHRDVHLLRAAMAAGASGYILKEDADQQLFDAIDALRQGREYVSPRLAEPQAADWTGTPRLAPGAGRQTGGLGRLTAREREILRLAAEGRSSREVGELLSISPRTVEHHRANIMTKLQLRSTAALVRYALEQGYL